MTNQNLPAFIRRDVERAIEDALHPKGMSTHDGVARIKVDRLQYLLQMIDAAPVEPEKRSVTNSINKEVLEFLRSFIAGGVNQDFKPWANELYQKLYRAVDEPEKQPVINERTVIDAAVKSGVVDARAVEDPEGYDNGETLGRLRAMAELLRAAEPTASIKEMSINAKAGQPVEAMAVFEGGAVKAWAASLVDWFRESGGQNYVTCDLRDSETGEAYAITMQKAGGRTPAQDLLELRASVNRQAEPKREHPTTDPTTAYECRWPGCSCGVNKCKAYVL